MKNVRAITLRDGVRAFQGVCDNCGDVLIRLARQTDKEQWEDEPARCVEEEIKAFVRSSPLNRWPPSVFDGEPVVLPIEDSPDNIPLFEEPLVAFADGDDPLFEEYKRIIGPRHLTPREALAKAYNRELKDLPERLSVISYALPLTSKIRKSNLLSPGTQTAFYGREIMRVLKEKPSVYIAGYKLLHGKKDLVYSFDLAIDLHMEELLREMGYLAVAPELLPYFQREYIHITESGYERDTNLEGAVIEVGSNWSQRHIAYVAGLGTFGLNSNFITERGCSARFGSVVTDLVLPPNVRTAKGPFSNCLFFVDGGCKACITSCPVGAITSMGLNPIACLDGLRVSTSVLDPTRILCGKCWTNLPCATTNPVKKKKQKE
jgi:ferredoxin